MKRMPYQLKVHEKKEDAGFSLVEVLVCIAIVALISVPIMAGFRTSALYTNHAHTTQVVTAYAQETLETVKSVDVDTFKAQILASTDADGNANGSVDESDVDTALQAQFDSSYSSEFFKKIICRQNNINIGGNRYNMEVVYDPVDYSQKKDPSLDAFSDTPADDANVYAVNEVDSVNGMLFPVIADEISKYEGTGADAAAVLYNLQGQLKENQLIETDSEANRIAAIYQNLTKKVKVTILNNGSETTAALGGTNYVQNSIKVTCDITYESTYNGVALKQIYNVFSGNYELLGRLSGAEVEEWEKGGKIYIFARAYQDQFLLNAPAANIIEIENNYSGSGKLDIYLVRGYYFDKASEADEATNKRGLQFDQVIVNGTTYSSIPSTTVLSGELSSGNTYFHTNIKGMLGNRQLQASDFEETVGMAKPTLRCYKVTIHMYERDDAGNDGDEVANIETTKEIR